MTPAPKLYLRQWREHRGLTVSELARRARISHPSVFRWETGEREPRGKNLDRLARALGLTVPELYAAPPKSEPKPKTARKRPRRTTR